MPSTKLANVVKMGKPIHLAVLKTLVEKLKSDAQETID
jgi:hypothetical protein